MSYNHSCSYMRKVYLVCKDFDSRTGDPLQREARTSGLLVWGDQGILGNGTEIYSESRKVGTWI